MSCDKPCFTCALAGIHFCPWRVSSGAVRFLLPHVANEPVNPVIEVKRESGPGNPSVRR